MVSKTGIRQRARGDEQKLERRNAILEAAERLFVEAPFAAITMSDVALRSGIAKGTVYLYFATKEQLFLSLLEERLGGWFEDLGRRLSGSHGAWAPARVAGTIAQSFAGRETLVRLLALLESVLEHNVEADTARAFKHALRVRVVSAGELLEERLMFLGPGDGARLLLHMRAVVVGLWQMADNAPIVRQVLDEDPALGVFRIDFHRELATVLEHLLLGAERAATEER